MTNVLRSRFARPLVLAAAVLVALGACGGDDDGGAGGQDADGSTTLASVFPTIPPVTPAPGTVTVAPVVTNPDGTPVAPSTVSPGQVTTPAPPGTTVAGATTLPGGVAGVYTVKAGDCLACIAQDLGVDFDALLEVNGFTADSLITPGQKIKVPSGGSAPADSGDGATSTTASSGSGSPAVAGQYTVVAGDCWSCIATKLGVDFDDLLAVNGANADTLLVPGQKIKVPTGGGGDSSTTVAATTTTTR